MEAVIGEVREKTRGEIAVVTLADIGDLLQRVREALDEAARGEAARSANNPYAQQQAVETVRANMRQIVLTLQPPGAIITSAETGAPVDVRS